MEFFDERNANSTLTLKLTVTSAYEDCKETIEKCLYVVNDIALSVWQSVLSSGHYERLGSVEIIQGGRKHTASEIYINISKDTLLVRNLVDIPDDLLYTWLHLVLLDGTRSILILDGLHSACYTGIDLKDKVAVLFTTTVDESTKMRYSTFPLIAPGNVIAGCAAALICYSECNSIKAIFCASSREASYTVEAAKVFESLSSQLCNFLDLPDLEFTQASYQRNMKRDPYLFRTENMFT
jgi:predicted ATP-grasp superfamily ATP-dependent carboligase